LALIASLLRRLRSGCHAAGNQEQRTEQSDLQTLRCFIFEVSSGRNGWSILPDAWFERKCKWL